MSNKHGLGRLYREDERDWPVSKLRAMIDAGVAEPVPIQWPVPARLQQGSTNHCVGFAWAGFKSAAGDQAVTNDEGHRIYYEAKKIDNDGPEMLERGTYVRSGAMVLKNEGFIDGFSLTDDIDVVDDWIQRNGCVVVGTNWYGSMFHPDASGVVTIDGNVAGGHAYLRIGDLQTPADNSHLNSWKNWGIDQMFWYSQPDARRLLREWGEACLCVRKTDVPPPRWPDLPPMDLDDLLSQDAAWKSGILRGFDDHTFHPQPTEEHPAPWGLVTMHQVGNVAWRIGAIEKNPFNSDSDFITLATRGLVHHSMPMLTFREERWEECLTRFQLLLLVGRYLREKGTAS